MFTISFVSLLLPFPDPQIRFRSLTTTRIWCLGCTSCFGPLKGGRKNGYNFVAILVLALKTIFTSSFWKYIAPFFAIYRHVFLQSVIHEKKVLTILMSFLLVSKTFVTSPSPPFVPYSGLFFTLPPISQYGSSSAHCVWVSQWRCGTEDLCDWFSGLPICF